MAFKFGEHRVRSSFRLIDWTGVTINVDPTITFFIELLITGARQATMRLVMKYENNTKHVAIPGKLSRELTNTPESAGDSIDVFVTENEDGSLNYEFRYGNRNHYLWRQLSPNAIFGISIPTDLPTNATQSASAGD
ncbi:MAG: hypothetical protein IT410_03665 [Candidatus Doudnabacteria bacterium]|nr:hypothetical protein [Candidatus Doudnabacteria bacterium]